MECAGLLQVARISGKHLGSIRAPIPGSCCRIQIAWHVRREKAVRRPFYGLGLLHDTGHGIPEGVPVHLAVKTIIQIES